MNSLENFFASNSVLGNKLIVASDDKQIVLSPLSIHEILGALHLAAEENTDKELTNLLGGKTSAQTLK